ncbi:EAL domain-containing protein [Pseudomonas sp. X10]
MSACTKSVCLSRECLVGASCPRQATHIFVVLQNYQHLYCAYGGALAETVRQELCWRLRAWGEPTAVAGQGFLLALEQNTTPSALMLENLLLACTTRPVEYQEVEVLPVISAGFANVDPVADTFTRIERCGPGGIGSLAPVQYSFAWRLGYRCDMARALKFVQHLQRGQMFLVFQPIRRVAGRSAELYQESLLRIVTPSQNQGQEVADLIGALERLGLARLLDHSVVRRVIELLEADPSLRLGCNVSVQSAVSDAWWVSAFCLLRRDKQVAARLTVELTESASPGTGEDLLEFVSRLNALGCRLAADDFGVGFSGLGLLLAAQFDVVKLDRRFLQAARLGPSGADLFNSTLRLCRQLALQVVVEGVERPEDLERLMGLETPLWGQGFLLGTPGQSARLGLPGPGKALRRDR